VCCTSLVTFVSGYFFNWLIDWLLSLGALILQELSAAQRGPSLWLLTVSIVDNVDVLDVWLDFLAVAAEATNNHPAIPHWSVYLQVSIAPVSYSSWNLKLVLKYPEKSSRFFLKILEILHYEMLKVLNSFAEAEKCGTGTG